MLAKIALDQISKRFEGLEKGTLKLVTPDGQARVFSGKAEGHIATLNLHDWSVLTNVARRGNVGLAEDYRAGKWDTDNLLGLIQLGLENKASLRNFVLGNVFFRKLSSLAYLLRLNTLRGSRRNIGAHYDLGNDFYQLWLDPSMTYSSALFHSDQESLQMGQMNKYDRILDCMDAPSGNLLEIGCGWGGFGERALQRGDYDYKGITLSHQQHDYAAQRLGQPGKIVLEDYRAQQGRFDRIVSIEMFEAVGEKYWPTYFKQLGNLLKPGGKAVVQTITISEADFPKYRRGADFIRSFIFPGGMLPSVTAFKQSAASQGMKAEGEFFFGLDYARTLEEWLKTFDAKKAEIMKLGYDEGFIRLWRLYLAACAAGFRAGQINVMQVELSHA